MTWLLVSRARSLPRERRASRKRCPPALLLLERRVVARIDRLRQELLLVVSPELADVVVGLHGFVPEAQTVLGALFAQLPDVEVANHVAKMIELDRAAWRVSQVDRPHRCHQLGLVAGVAVERLEAGFNHLAVNVEQAGILARNGIEILQHSLDEAMVAVALKIERVWDAADETDRLVAEALEQSIVAACFAGDNRELQAGAVIGFHEAQRVRAGKTLTHAIAIANLRDIRRVVRSDQRRPDLLEDLAAGVFEGLLEAAHLFVAEREVFGDADDALQFQFLGGVVGHWMHGLRRGGRGADEIWIGTALRHVLGGGEAQQRHLVLRDVVGDRQQLEGREWSEDSVDLVALNQLLHLGLGAGGIAAGVGGKELHLAAGHRVVLLLQVRDNALFHLDAALGERAGFYGEQAELEWRRLRNRRCWKFNCSYSCAGGSPGHKFTTGDLAKHTFLPLQPVL